MKTLVRSLKRRFSATAKLERALSPCLPEVACVDVGASYYPHTKWHLLLESPRTDWIAVEPNSANLGYIANWKWSSRVSTCTTGLSDTGGERTLYVTNVDSGSSLLEPKILPSMSRRIRDLNYFFPLRKVTINTLTLMQAAASSKPHAPMFVKLDTQGTELSILRGADAWIREHRIVGIEMEATLLAQPIMEGSGKFWEACRYLEEAGLELLLVHPIYGPSRLGLKQPRGVTFINECDAVFAVRQDVAASLPATHRVALFAFYLCNRLFEEGLSMLDEDAEVRSLLTESGCKIDTLRSIIASLT